MKKNLLLAALMAVASVTSVSAEVLTPYEEQFENTIRPKGWLRGGASSYSQGTFTPHETGGHNGGYLSIDQYSDYFSSYYNNWGYNDLLLTPKVEGEVSIWVRKNGEKPALTYYAIADLNNLPSSASDFVKLEGTTDNIVDGMDLTDWTKITVSNVPAGTNLGIRVHNLDIDEFTATSADVLYRPGIIVDFDNLSEGGTKLKADSNNQVTFKFKVSLENTGDLDFPASEEGFTIELVNANLDNKVFGTGHITDAVPCGTKVEKEFTMTGDAEVAPGTTSNNYRIRISHALTNTVEGSLGYFTIIPYAPVPKLMFYENNYSNQSSYNDVNITGVINLGAGEAGTSRTLWMWNAGTAPLDITGIAVAGDFETSTEPFTLQADEKKSIAVAVIGDPGYKTGSVTFTDAALGEFKYDLAGAVTKAGDYLENFEGEAAPAGMVIGNAWSVKGAQENLKPLAGEKYIENTSTYNLDYFITPALDFAEGDKFVFMAAKNDNISSVLNVYTSPDRATWTPAKAIDAKDATPAENRFPADKPTGTGYGTYEMGLFAIDMPAGTSYVKFEAGGARVDNLLGGTLHPVSHDLFVVSTGLPEAASVNTRYITNITLRNILATPETDYAVLLEVNGEEVARAAETPEIALGAEATFDLRFTPHAVGDFTGKFVFTSGDSRIELSKFDFTVTEEKAEAIYQVGDFKIQSSDPLNTYYNCQSQTIYRAASLGMESGVKITGFTLKGCNDQPLSKHVKVWIANTDDEGYDPDAIVAAPKEEMTLVYDADYTFPVVGDGSTHDYQPVFVIPFTTPFTYDGRNIRLMIEQTDLVEGQENHNVFFTVDNSAYDFWNDIYDNRVIENQKEYAEDLDDEPSWHIYRTGFAVTYFNVAKDVVTAKGNVTDDFGAPVKDALVSFASDDILYSAKSDAEGNYSMNIINVNLVYSMTAEAEGFDSTVKSDITLDAAQPEAVFDILMPWTDRTATLSGVVTNSLENNEGIGEVTVTLTAGEVNASAVTDAFGNYSVTVPEFAGEFTVTLTDKAGDTLATEPYVFKSKADTKDFTVAVSSLEGISAVTDVKVTSVAGMITVLAPAGMNVEVYTATGVLVGSAVSEGTAISFGPLAPGLYIAAGVKTIVR